MTHKAVDSSSTATTDDRETGSAAFEMVFLTLMLGVSAVLFSDTMQMRVWQQKFTVEFLFYFAALLVAVRLAMIVYRIFWHRDARQLFLVEGLDRRTLVFVLSIIAVATLIPTLGLFAALFVFAAPMMAYLGVRPRYLALVIPAVMLAVFWIILVAGLGVRLPRGLLF